MSSASLILTDRSLALSEPKAVGAQGSTKVLAALARSSEMTRRANKRKLRLHNWPKEKSLEGRSARAVEDEQARTWAKADVIAGQEERSARRTPRLS